MTHVISGKYSASDKNDNFPKIFANFDMEMDNLKNQTIIYNLNYHLAMILIQYEVENM